MFFMFIVEFFRVWQVSALEVDQLNNFGSLAPKARELIGFDVTSNVGHGHEYQPWNRRKSIDVRRRSLHRRRGSVEHYFGSGTKASTTLHPPIEAPESETVSHQTKRKFESDPSRWKPRHHASSRFDDIDDYGSGCSSVVPSSQSAAEAQPVPIVNLSSALGVDEGSGSPILLGEFDQYDSRGVPQFKFGCFGWSPPPSGSSTSTTLGEFDGSNVDVLTGAPPRGARVVRLPGSPAVPI